MGSISKKRKHGVEKSAVSEMEANEVEHIDADLPSTAWVLDVFSDWHTINDEDLYDGSAKTIEQHSIGVPHYDECVELPSSEWMGEVTVKLANNHSIHLEDAIHVESVRYNLVSLKMLRSQVAQPLGRNSPYSLKMSSGHLHLVAKANGSKTQITARVANRIVLLTKEPSIEEIIEYASEHRCGHGKRDI